MKRRYYLAAGALAGLFVAAGSIERADSLPLFQHTSAAAFTNATCMDNGGWKVTLNITGTDLDKAPTATITTPQSPIVGALVPYSHAFMVPATQATYTVGVVVHWNDGVTNNLGQFTATKPDGCTVPTTVAGTTTTTTCGEAIPPRSDCATTTVPPATVPTTVAPTTVPTSPPDTPTVASTTGSVTRAPSSSLSSAPASSRIVLPTTGSGDAIPLVAIGAGILAAGVLLAAMRRRAA